MSVVVLFLVLSISDCCLLTSRCSSVSEFTHIKSSQVKLSFIVIPLHVWTYSGTRCRVSQDHGAT